MLLVIWTPMSLNPETLSIKLCSLSKPGTLRTKEHFFGLRIIGLRRIYFHRISQQLIHVRMYACLGSRGQRFRNSCRR